MVVEAASPCAERVENPEGDVVDAPDDGPRSTAVKITPMTSATNPMAATRTVGRCCLFTGLVGKQNNRAGDRICRTLS